VNLDRKGEWRSTDAWERAVTISAFFFTAVILGGWIAVLFLVFHGCAAPLRNPACEVVDGPGGIVNWSPKANGQTEVYACNTSGTPAAASPVPSGAWKADGCTWMYNEDGNQCIVDGPCTGMICQKVK
jgi:hypothetical protein